LTAPIDDISGLLEVLSALPSEQQLTRASEAGELSEVLLALTAEAERLANDDVSRGLGACVLVCDLADQADLAPARAKARTAHGQVLCHAGRHAEAIEVLHDGVSIAATAKAERELAWCRMVLVHPLAQLARYEEALAEGEAARAALLAQGDEQAAAGVDINLGATQRLAGDAKKALFHFDRARPLLEGDALRLARLDANRGNAFYSLHDFASALSAYSQALRSFEELDLAWAVAVMHENMGELMSRQGRLSQALTHFEEARRRLEGDEAPSDLARLQAEFAEAQAALGLTQEAIDALTLALPGLEEHGLRWEAARARESLGVALSQAKRFQEAAGELTRAAAEFRELEHPAAAARADVLRAQLLGGAGEVDEARALVARVLPDLAERPADAAIAQYHLASWALRDEQPDVAREHLAQALAAAESLGLAPLLADLLHLRGQLHRSEGRREEALADLREAVAQVERVRGSLQADRFRAAFLGNRLGLYEDLISLLVANGTPEALAAAFATAERAKSRSLLDLVRGGLEAAEAIDRSSADPAQSSMLDELVELRRQLNALYSELSDADEPTGQRLQPAAWRHRLDDHERRLRELELRLASLRSVQPLEAPPAELEQVAAALPAATALIEYYLVDGDFIAFVVRPEERFRCLRLAGGNEVTEVVRRLHFQINRVLRPGGVSPARMARHTADADRELGRLYELLVEPIEPLLGGVEHLVFVPHGVLHSVPLHALWDGSQHLFERWHLSCAPSGSLHMSMLSRAEQRDHGQVNGDLSRLVLGVPDAAAPRIADEVERVSAHFPEAIRLCDAAADSAAIVAHAPAAGHIHIACHGRFLPNSPLSSGLRLADRWFTARDVLELRLQADLVVLSGCDTGRNLIGAGDELHGLLRGFLAAGACSLITSLWTVDDATATSMISSFYESWQSSPARSGAKAAALREAWQSAHADNPHPAYWAPFTLIGAP
jgi:tetratricopeptide (TPR) repeat protein